MFERKKTQSYQLEREEKREIESNLFTVRKRLDEVKEAYEKKMNESTKIKVKKA